MFDYSCLSGIRFLNSNNTVKQLSSFGSVNKKTLNETNKRINLIYILLLTKVYSVHAFTLFISHNVTF